MRKGFTLIELLIVIGILAILATTVVLVLNPGEILKEARDTQRISDLQAIVAAASLAFGTDSSADIIAANVGPFCTDGVAGAECNPFSGGNCAGGVGLCTIRQTTTIGGAGWVGINFGNSSSITNLPLDPLHEASSNSTGCVVGPPIAGYCYAYKGVDVGNTFELDARLESTKHSGKMGTDGGSNVNFYEVGTDPSLDL